MNQMLQLKNYDIAIRAQPEILKLSRKKMNTKVYAQFNKERNILGIDELHKFNVMGHGITVAIIDTGCFPHLDFCAGRNRISKFCDLINKKEKLYDDNGHGTFVAGILGGSGLTANGRFRGVAPKCGMVILKALDRLGETEVSTILDAMQFVHENRNRYNIKVVCMSFGSSVLPKNDPLIKGAESLWNSGVTVVCAGGNDGPDAGSIRSPGASAKIITVGSAKFNELKGFNAADFSSRGPAINNISKPDILAPGVDLTGASNRVNFYTQMSGTSVSTPIVAGTVALLLSRFPYYEPDQIKSVLLHTASSLDCERNTCGRGLVNPYAAVME